MSTNETWQSTVSGRIVVRFTDVEGRRDQMIQSGRTFTISPEDRRMNQNAVADKVYDPFTNGSFVPVDLPAASVEELGQQPNHVNEAQVEAIALGARIDASYELRRLTAPAAVNRVLEAAADLGATDERLGMIAEHLQDIDPALRPTFGPRNVKVGFQQVVDQLPSDAKVNQFGEPVVR